MRRIEYSTLPTRLHWFAWPTWISAALLVHFLISIGIWSYWFFAILRYPKGRDMLLSSLWSPVPAFALCALSGVLFVCALRGRHVARRGVLFLLVVAATFFFVDVYFGRWQIDTFIATQDYWDSGGREHEYLTWWWFNDRWLR